MFSVTARISKQKLGVAIAFIMAVGIITAVWLLFPKDNEGVNYNTAAGSDEECAAFFAQFGWEIDPTGKTEKEILIPDVFDEVYAGYNEIQLAQGMDLTPYKGRSVRLVTYPVTNYPDRPSGVNGNLLILNNTVIGGDVSTTELGGFMHGFNLTGTGLPFGQMETAPQGD